MFAYIIVALAAIIIGYLGVFFLLFLLSRKLRSENNLQRKLLRREAGQKIKLLKEEEQQRTDVKLQAALEDLESSIADRTSDLKVAEEDLNERQRYLDQEEARLLRREKDLEAHMQKLAKVREEAEIAERAIMDEKSKVQSKLAETSGVQVTEVCKQLADELVQKKRLETTKHLKLISEELNTNVQRLANRMLARTHSRYAPEFIWPKGMNHVEVLDARVADMLAATADNGGILSELAELTEHVNIVYIPAEKPEHTPIVRLGGGYGIFKEAAKLTLEEVLPRGPQAWSKVRETYEKHRKTLEAKALVLGKQALVDLKLNGMHVEILKMVGALNWRTSYRQNQYYHSVEVAKLAGILATELGVDPDEAKRCGLLHDIGKSIDYRIEGSHAVISGDYADRYGESKIICDTVMSHHADLIVETPLAYVLQAADALSGARPGARVNLEEGYQDRLSSIQDVVRAFPGVMKVEIMNGAREVHVEVHHKKVKVEELESLSSAIAKQIEDNVTYPGQIKILVTRRFESVAVA